MRVRAEHCVLVDIGSLQSLSVVSQMRRGRRGTRHGASASQVSKWSGSCMGTTVHFEECRKSIHRPVECSIGAPRRIVHCNCDARGEHRNHWLRCLTLLLRQAWNASQQRLFQCHRVRGARVSQTHRQEARRTCRGTFLWRTLTYAVLTACSAFLSHFLLTPSSSSSSTSSASAHP